MKNAPLSYVTFLLYFIVLSNAPAFPLGIDSLYGIGESKAEYYQVGTSAEPSPDETAEATADPIPAIPSRSPCPLLLPQGEGLPQISKIIGGSPLSINNSILPYVALIYNIHSESSIGSECTAVIIGQSTIFTAAHCLSYMPRWYVKKYYKIYFGSETSEPMPGSVWRSIENFVIHPRFELNDFSTIRYDVAYITLNQSIPEMSKMMKVNENESLPVPGSVVRLAGYGSQHLSYDYPNSQFGRDIMRLDLPVTNFSYCKTVWDNVKLWAITISEKHHVCVGYLNGGCNTCAGDSGGPLIQFDADDHPVLLAVTSFAYRCGMSKVPNVYVKIAPFLRKFLPTTGLSLTNKTVSMMLPEDKRVGPYSPEPFLPDDFEPDESQAIFPSPSGGVEDDDERTLEPVPMVSVQPSVEIMN